MHLSSPQRTRAGALKVLLIVLALLVCGLVLTGVALARSLRVPPHPFPDFRAQVIRDLDLKIRSDVEVNPPPLLFGLARLASHCADIEPEARHAMRAVRGARVGVYELAEHPDRQTQRDLIRVADARCQAIGWQRVAYVMDERDLVLVYVSEESALADQLDVFVLTLNDRELAAIAACGKLDSLSDLITAALHDHKSDWFH